MMEAFFQSIASTLGIANFLHGPNGKFSLKRLILFIFILLVIFGLVALVLHWDLRKADQTLSDSPAPAVTVDTSIPQTRNETGVRNAPSKTPISVNRAEYIPAEAPTKPATETPAPVFGDGAEQKTEGDCSPIINGSLSGGINCEKTSSE